MIKIEDDIKVWITSDTHYAHKNICRGVSNWISSVKDDFESGKITPIEYKEKMESLIKQTRPFNTIEEMNETIIKNINDNVDQDDTLIHLGDWSFGGFENIQKLRDRIICKNIHLILGNHDHHIKNNREGVKTLFKSVSQYNEVEYMGETIVVMHYPITSWDGLRKGRIHLHGHCHLPNDMKISKNGRRMDVGIDGNENFKPYLLKDCIKILKKLPIGSELGAVDHHTDRQKAIIG